MEPKVKLLMKLTKNQLLYKACEYRLVGCKHDKLSLAKAIAEYEEKRFKEDWSTISNG